MQLPNNRIYSGPDSKEALYQASSNCANIFENLCNAKKIIPWTVLALFYDYSNDIRTNNIYVVHIDIIAQKIKAEQMFNPDEVFDQTFFSYFFLVN